MGWKMLFPGMLDVPQQTVFIVLHGVMMLLVCRTFLAQHPRILANSFRGYSVRRTRKLHFAFNVFKLFIAYTVFSVNCEASRKRG